LFGFVCVFWSGGTLSQEQIVELAFGLESSNHKFLWVVIVRAPSSSSSSAAYFSISAQNDVDLSQFLFHHGHRRFKSSLWLELNP
jgi:hydroquinone glucosyltransferase